MIFCVATKIIAEIVRLAFFFLIAWFENYVDAFSRVIHMGVESGEILAQRPLGGAGRAGTAKSRSSRSAMWITHRE